MNKLKLSNDNQDKKVITFTINGGVKKELRGVLADSINYNPEDLAN